jgi:hypothetical protein
LSTLIRVGGIATRLDRRRYPYRGKSTATLGGLSRTHGTQPQRSPRSIARPHRPGPLSLLWAVCHDPASSVALGRTRVERGCTANWSARGTQCSRIAVRALYEPARGVDASGVKAGLVDCGVFDGGSTVPLAAGAPRRTVWSFDSFEGLLEQGQRTDTNPRAGKANVSARKRRSGTLSSASLIPPSCASEKGGSRKHFPLPPQRSVRSILTRG